MRHLESYKIFEATSHWKDDLILNLSWDRLDEIHDFVLDFVDLGWSIPQKSSTERYGHKIDKLIMDSSFRNPSKKIDLLERDYYQGYLVGIKSTSTSKLDKEFFKQIVEFLTKLEGYGYKYMITSFNHTSMSFCIIHPEDIVDPSLVIGDMKKARLNVSVGVNNAYERLVNHKKIMNIEKKDDKLYITQLTDRYNLDKIHDIIIKTLNKHGERFNIIKDDTNNRVIVARNRFV